MTNATPSPDEIDIPTDLAERLDAQETDTLRRTLGYIRALLREREQHRLDQIEAGPDEEIVRVTEHDGYTAVVKRLPCAEGCADCPHEPYLYHVRAEDRPDGGQQLKWTLIGEVTE